MAVIYFLVNIFWLPIDVTTVCRKHHSAAGFLFESQRQENDVEQGKFRWRNALCRYGTSHLLHDLSKIPGTAGNIR
jgi:hypothetical protein